MSGFDCGSGGSRAIRKLSLTGVYNSYFRFDRSPSRVGVKRGLVATSRLVETHRRKAPDSSKGSEPATFTPERLATRGTGQAATQRAAEHGSITPYPTKPVALDYC